MKRAPVSSILAAVALLTLGLTAEARMNVPGRAEGNWSWRCTEEMMSAPAFDWLRDLTRSSNRLCKIQSPLTSEMAEAAS